MNPFFFLQQNNKSVNGTSEFSNEENYVSKKPENRSEDQNANISAIKSEMYQSEDRQKKNYLDQKENSHPMFVLDNEENSSDLSVAVSSNDKIHRLFSKGCISLTLNHSMVTIQIMNVREILL